MTMKKLNVLVPSVLALFVASAAHAGATFDTPQGKLSVGGDVEFDVTADNYSENTTKDGVAVVGDATDTQQVGGRILVDISGERALANGNYANFKVNPLYGQKGEKNLDDAWFGFGVKNDWGFKIGHFEAYDLSPAGQDTYVVGYGDNIYRAKDGRGRSNNGGQIMLTKEAGQLHYEVTTQFGETGDTSYVNMYSHATGFSASPVYRWPVVELASPVSANVGIWVSKPMMRMPQGRNL
jgi:hypothetical protein